jgi:hypothetical protein
MFVNVESGGTLTSKPYFKQKRKRESDYVCHGSKRPFGMLIPSSLTA